MKKVAILQSNYIPWKGYFDLIAFVDEFILYDDMQYTRRDWRNRNQIKTPRGIEWLTIPVQVKGKFHQKIRDTETEGSQWGEQHWKTLAHNYRSAPHFEEIATWLKPLFHSISSLNLSLLNRRFIEAICAYLGIKTTLKNSWDYPLSEGKSERLADLCLAAGAHEYVSGPAARDYLDPNVFQARGLKVRWFDYEGYPEYPQLYGKFVHGVSIVDLLFNCGPEARNYMRYALK